MRNAPWAHSGVARESLLFGDMTAGALPSGKSIERLYERYNNVVGFSTQTDFAEVITPLMYEQFPFQGSVFNEISRVTALLGPRPSRRDWPWEDLLGLPLDAAVRASMVLHAWIAHNGGRYDPKILDLNHVQEVFEEIAPRNEIEALVKFFTTTVSEARASVSADSYSDPRQGKYAFNPLRTKPLVDLGVNGIWAPVASIIPRALSVANLYYLGAAAWGYPFTNDLGERTEDYVGDQLGQVAGINLRPEVHFRLGKSEGKSVDWIWIHDDAVILIESKSARLSFPAQTDSSAMRESANRYLVKARKQIDATASLIRAGQPEFASIPADRPIIGITLTSEPFYLGNSTLPQYGPPSETPSMVISLGELEQLVCYPANLIVSHLLHLIRDSRERTWSLSNTFKEFPTPSRNVILDDAFSRYDHVSFRT